MSDSESDLLPSNVYTFQNESTAFCAKGPNVNSTNLTGLSFRNNVLTSTMQMPRNFERQRYRELSFDQRSMSYRRETSPMSMYSDMRPKNFHHSFYPGGMSSQRSVYNGRSGSPISMRSMDSNASVSAVDIAMAFKNANFNKYDLKMIKEAYNKLMKRKVRKKVEKRRNMRLFLKGYRRKSGYDSGEQGSDSSISSDDCRSTHSAMYKDNMSSCRSTRTDITDFRRSIKESNMYKDCTNHFKSNAFKNMFSASPNTTGNNDRVNIQTVTQNLPTLNQKERFKNGFLLPSQRFNKSVASVPIPEKERAQTKPTFNSTNTGKCAPQETNDIHEKDSDQEEIFSEVTVRENSNHNLNTETNIVEGKRSLEIEDRQCSDRKRTKLSSPKKQNKANDKMVLNIKGRNVLREDNINNNNKKTGDFEFVKPQLPLRKSAPGKFKDKLISKSAPPLVDVIVPPPKTAPEKHVQNTVQNDPPCKKTIPTTDDKINTDKTTEEHADTIYHSNSDMSMRPSFIKRKLFTQKMDVTESKNLSLEAINVNSPETNVYSAIQKEKHKARKLVTNQSCLNRDVIQENNNLLDLIHKIVPADQMNLTNVTNKTSLSSRQSKDNKHVDDDKWDVTSIISTCNNDDVSDTYTDEEIFHDNNKPNKNTLKEKPVPKPQPVNDCSIVIARIPETKMVIKNKVADCKLPTPKKAIDNKNKSVLNCVKSFWDTDFESDLESPAPKRWADLREKTINTINSIPERDISFSNQNNKSMQVSKKISDTHNTTSLSECLKSNVNHSVLDYTMGKLKKYNINRNLTIKAFRTPKIKITENNKKEKKADTITMSPNKKELARNRKHQTIDVKEKQTEVKQYKTEIRNTKVAANKVVESAKKTKNTNTKAKNVEAIMKKPEIKKAIENVTSTKELATQNKVKSNSLKPQIHDVQNVNNAKTRVLRTPKKQACCDDSLEIERKQQKKSIENMKENVNPKCNTSKSTKPNKKVCSPGNHKKAEHPTILELEPMNRTLRTRKIDLSSSLNTTNENGANITIKSLRSRRINLSSSINNSTLEGNLTIVKKKLPRTPVKKPISKIRNEVKRPRMVKNNSVKG